MNSYGNCNLIQKILSEENITLVNLRYLEDAELEVNNIKGNSDGFTAIGIKEALNIWHQWHIPNKELIKNIKKLVGRNDIYISINSMLSPLRQLKNLRHLHAFWVDLDYYKIAKYKNKSTEEMIDILRQQNLFKDLEPSFFLDSGNGLYIFYLIESATIGALPIWQKIQNSFHNRFKEFGADSQSIDAVHVLRLAGTKNSKTNKFSRFLFNSKTQYRYEAIKESIRIYNIQNLSKIMLPDLPHSKEDWIKIKNSKKETKKVINAKKELALYNLHTLHYSRLKDIELLQKIRDGNCMGHREIMCFLYRYYSCLFIKNKESSLANLLEFNKNFKNPLSEDEVINATISAEKSYDLWEVTLNNYLHLTNKPSITSFFSKNGCYIYSNKKLIKLLDINEKEMESLRTIISTKEKNKRSRIYRNQWKKTESKKNRRNYLGLTTRQQNKLNNLLKILELKDKNLKQKDIALALDITQQAVSKLINEYKKGLLDKNILSILNKISSGEMKSSLNTSMCIKNNIKEIVDVSSFNDLINF